MANSTTLKMKFKDTGGEDMLYNLSRVSEDVEDAQVKALMNGMITNKTVFEKGPTTAISAELVTTITTPIDLA